MFLPPPIVFTRAVRISPSFSASIVRPTIFACVDVVQLGRRLDPLHDRHVRGLVAEVAEVDRERRLRGARDADEHDVRLVEAAADAVVELDRELDRLHPLEVRRVERRPRARRHLRRHPGDLRDRLDRMAEQVGVVEPCAAAERAHRLAQLAVDERVDHHGRPALRPADGELEVVDRLDLRVAHLLERLLRELRLERGDEARGGLSRRVREDVELDGLAGGFIGPARPAAVRRTRSRARRRRRRRAAPPAPRTRRRRASRATRHARTRPRDGDRGRAGAARRRSRSATT